MPHTFNPGDRVICDDPRESRFQHTGTVTMVGVLVYVEYPPASLPDGGAMPREVAHRPDQIAPVEYAGV